jgi:polyphosphate kinase
MQEVVGQRHFGSAVRLEVAKDMPEKIRSILVGNLGVAPYQVYEVVGPMGRSDLMELMRVDRPDLKDPPFKSRIPPALRTEESIFSVLKERDVLLYHPYDSFKPVVDLIRKAASDPNVVAIKQTLYRVGPNSPIVTALREARENGKQVSAIVELKARFDEENNIVWARALERAGVHVVYGLVGLKTHAKMCLIVRRESDGVRRYVHLGTGNYNPVTARIYTDLGYLTSDPDITADISDLFNALTGYSRKQSYRKILVSPHGMRTSILERIKREIDCHEKNNGGGHIAMKMNSLVDKACIRALYEASQAGVRVDLQIRGICCLRPGVPRVSENIHVTSVVGRFLEHPRIYYFHNCGEKVILMGSADLMPRNLDGRVEVLFPIQDARLRDSVRDDVLNLHLADNVKARVLGPDGKFRRLAPTEQENAIDSQATRLAEPGSWHFEV